jgi:peptidoglycan LD-endopeptidase LytH
VRCLRLTVLLVVFTPAFLLSAPPSLDLAWPTPNTAFFEGKPIEAYVQATASGEPTSGMFGCTRSGGLQFHEGVDLKPIKRDSHGEPTDEIFATMAGVIRHISARAGDSNYGRYIVIEHPDAQPCVYSLYAHLSAIAPGLKEGDSVTAGQRIATMGHSSSGAIPKERAHLHFEIGLWATRQFQSWYSWKKFGSSNEHGLFNGMNLMGIDPVDFFKQFRAHSVDGFSAYFAQLPAVAYVRVATSLTPDFIQRYPQLLSEEVPLTGVAGWEVKVNCTGLPFSWKPLKSKELLGFRPNEVRVSNVDAEALRHFRGKSIAVVSRGKYQPGRDLETMLQLVFGLR